jgi:hypothetical protein
MHSSMRLLFVVLMGLACVPAAAAQDAAGSPELARATRALAAIWRPVSGGLTGPAIDAACAGALEEMAAVEAALPPVLTPESLSRVRALRGLLIVPAEGAAGQAYFFPPRDLLWLSSGLGAISVVNETEGYLALRDAAGRDFAVQLGRAGRTAVLRIRPPEGEILSFVGCAPVA